MKKYTCIYHLIGAFLAISVLPLSIQAQESNGLMNVRIVTVKQDHVRDWIDLQRELTESMKEAGAPGRSIWEVVKGDHNTFHILTNLDGWADYDNPGENGMTDTQWANWLNEILPTIQSRQELTVRTFRPLDIPDPDGSKRNLLGLRRHMIKHNHTADFYGWLRDRLVPTLKKLGEEGRYFGRVIAGDDTAIYYHARSIDSWAQLDEPFAFAALSESERTKLFDEDRGDWIIKSEQIILQYREDLSFQSDD